MAKKSILKNYTYHLAYQILVLILPLITTPYVSRVLGAEAIGIYGYTYSIVTYFILFGSLGIALYGQREIAYAQENKKARMKAFVEIILFRFVTMTVSILAYYFFFVKGGEYQVYYKILMIALIASAFDISWFFQGLEEFKKTVLRNIIVRLASVTLVFCIVKTPEDLIKYTLIYSLADFIGNISLWFYLPKYFKGVKIENINIKKHIPQICLLFIPQIAHQIYNMLDKTMIGMIISDKSEVGYYEQAQKIIRILLTIVTSLGTVMIPRMASTFASGDTKKVNEYMKKSFNFVFLLSFPLMFGIASVSEPFVPIFFGQGYDKVVLLITIICPIVLLMGVANVIGTQYLLPTKRQKEYTICTVIGVIVNFILNYILISRYESIGASIATVASQLVVDIGLFYVIRKEIKPMSIIKLSYKYIIAGILMFCVCFTIKHFISSGVVSITAQVAAGALVYFALLFKLKDEFILEMFQKVKEKFNLIKNKLNRKKA